MLRFAKQLAISTEVKEMAVARMDVVVVVEMEAAVNMVAVAADMITHTRQHYDLMQLCLLPHNMRKQW